MSDALSARDVYARTEQLLELHRPAQARTLIGSFLAGNPEDRHGLCLAAQSALSDGDPAAARTLAQSAVRLGANDDWVWRLIAIACSRSGDHPAAVDAGQRAVAADPDGWQAYQTLSVVSAAAPGGVGEAVRAGQWAVRLGPRFAATHRALGSASIAAGDLRAAEQSLREALRIDPADAIALNELGRVLLRRKDHAGAARHFMSAVGADARLNVAAHNLDVAITVAVSRLFVAVFLVLFIPARLAATSSGSVSSVATVVTMVALAAVVGWQVISLRPMVSGGLGRYVRGLPARDRVLTSCVACILLAVVATAVLCFVPHPAQTVLLTIAAAALVVSRILLWRRGKQQRERSGRLR